MTRHHALLVTGDLGQGIEAALAYGERELGLSPAGNPDVIVLRFLHLSVEDARLVGTLISRAAFSGKRLIVIAAERLFHEAQNALLKSFEEPPLGTTLVLAVSSAGDLLETLQSRLVPLPEQEVSLAATTEGAVFLSAPQAARTKMLERILERAKKDAPEEKQAARAEALRLLEGISREAYARFRAKPTPALRALLGDLDRLIPILHERAAPLKPILEHVLIAASIRM